MSKDKPVSKTSFKVTVEETKIDYEEKIVSSAFTNTKEEEVIFEPKEKKIEHLNITVYSLDIDKLIKVLYPNVK